MLSSTSGYTSRLAASTRAAETLPRSSSPAAAYACPPASLDDRSAQIADYVEKRRQAMLNAEAIKKERAREAEMRRMNGGGGDRAGQSSQPPIPRSGIVRGDASSSSSEANSAATSRRGSRGRDSGDGQWGRSSRAGDQAEGEEEDGRLREDDSPALHRYAKPQRSPTKPPTTALAMSAAPTAGPLPSPLPPAGKNAIAPPPPSRVAACGPLSPTSASALVGRVAELEAAVESLERQQRFFLAFMETTQAQLSLMRGTTAATLSAAAVTGRSVGRAASQMEPSASQRKQSTAAPSAARRPNIREEEEKRRLSRGDDSEEEEEGNEQGEDEEEEEEVDYSGRYRRTAQPPPTHPPAAQQPPPTASRRPPPHAVSPYSAEPPTHSRNSSSGAQAARPFPPTDDRFDSSLHHSAQRTASRPQGSPSSASAPPASVSSYDVDESMEDDPFPAVPTFPCPACGRRFNEAALAKHTAKGVCRRSRKPFDVKAQRLGEVVAELAKVQGSQGRTGGEAKSGRGRKEEKGGKWRQERARLQEAIAAGKAIEKALKEGKSLASIPVAVSSIPDDRVQCPHCLRRFAENSADRHIPHCKNKQSRMNSSANRAQLSSSQPPQALQSLYRKR